MPYYEGTWKGETIKGSPYDDEIYGKGGDDTLKGKKGDDEIYGNKGNDYLKGGPGDDDLHGGQGYDYLKGGRGDDWLNGGKDDDCLRGGKGDDTFVYKGNWWDGPGKDIIEDFEFKDGKKKKYDDKTDYSGDAYKKDKEYDEEDDDGHNDKDHRKDSHDTLIIDYKKHYNKVYAELESEKDFVRFTEKYESDGDKGGWRSDGVDVYLKYDDLVISFGRHDKIVLKDVLDDKFEEKLYKAGADYYHDYLDVV